MIEGCPFLYQDPNRNVYHVSENGVSAVQEWLSNKSIVAFVDGDENYKPNAVLLRSSVQLVVASPPKGANDKWPEQAGQHVSVTNLVVNLWSPKELFLTGLVLTFLSTLD